MTENEKLIKDYQDAIDVIKSNMPTSGYYMLREACEMAIKALEYVQEYRKIGTVEECREAVEKTKAKKCVKDSCPDHVHYKCPTCGKIQKTKYNTVTHGCILNNCSNCGQKLEEED